MPESFFTDPIRAVCSPTLVFGVLVCANHPPLGSRTCARSDAALELLDTARRIKKRYFDAAAAAAASTAANAARATATATDAAKAVPPATLTPYPSAKLYTQAITALSRSGRLEDALRLLGEVTDSGGVVLPFRLAYVALIQVRARAPVTR